MKWQPWEDYAAPPEVLPIDGPPCSGCQFWKPVRLYDRTGRSDGVRCCHAPEQFHDFSCYHERKEPTE